MTIKLDISPCSVVVVCSECPHWFAFAWSAEEGRQAAGRHEALMHPADDQIRHQLAQNRRRHAARRAPIPSMPR